MANCSRSSLAVKETWTLVGRESAVSSEHARSPTSGVPVFQPTNLKRTSSSHNFNPLYPAIFQLFQSVLGNITVRQFINRRHQYPRHIQRHISLTDNNSRIRRVQHRIQRMKLREAIVPVDKRPCANHALGFFVWNAHESVLRGSVGEDNAVVVVP